MSWKNTADSPTAATARAIAAAIGAPCHAAARGHRRVGHRHDGGVAVLLELAGDQRAEVVERRLRPVDRRQAVARLPVAQADEVEPGPLEDAGVIAERELLHPPQDEQLDLGDLAQVDEVDARASARGPPPHVADHGTGTDRRRRR